MSGVGGGGGKDRGGRGVRMGVSVDVNEELKLLCNWKKSRGDRGGSGLVGGGGRVNVNKELKQKSRGGRGGGPVYGVRVDVNKELKSYCEYAKRGMSVSGWGHLGLGVGGRFFEGALVGSKVGGRGCCWVWGM